MSRPGLVIGLGGTGQWVLTWLKRDLLLSNNGQMPANVRLLEIDTATRLEANTSRITASGQKEEAAVVGGVTLGEGEFVYVGGDSRPLAERVKGGKLKQIGQWYQADKWLSTQAPATFILDDGAGRLRQFGRMAIFKDILGQQAGSRIWRALRTAIEAVRSATNEQRRLEIMVVGSFAGGTGSGMFIDTALILRMLAQQLNVHHVLRGFFALPSVFTTNPDGEMKARTFAAWRELNRFMVVDSDFPMPLVEYVEENPDFRIRPSQRLFDACYLVDGKRAGQPLAEEAKYGAFPMMAESLSAMLDNEAGAAYTEWIFTNLAPEYARRPETPMYSAIGAFTVQVPAHFVQEISGHTFAQDMLLKLLGPRVKPDKDGRLISSGAERHLALAAPDQNLEDKGFAGRTRSRRLLRESISYASKVAKPTTFLSRIADLVESITDGNRRAAIIDQLARSGGGEQKSGSGATGWVAYFPDLGDDPRFDALRKTVREYMAYNIVQQYGRRDGQSEEEARANFKKIPEDVRTRFGGLTASGEEIEDFHGSCGEVLKECKQDQIILARQIVRLRLLDILMGHSENALIARSGKLGYARDYFDGLVNDLDEFLKLMTDVKRRREELKPELKVANLSEQARKFMAAVSGKKIFWFWEHPDVKGSELGYLQAQNRLMDIRREDVLQFYVVEAALELKELFAQARDATERWILHLATGDDASQTPGLWDNVRRDLAQVKAAHAYDASAPKVQMLVADKPLEISEADLEKALRQWEWTIDFEGEPPSLKVQAKLTSDAPGEQAQTMTDPKAQRSSEERLQIGYWNESALLKAASRQFSGVAARSTAAEEIKRQFPKAEDFASQIADISAEPLFDGDPQASPRKKSNLIRIKTDTKDPYFTAPNGLEGILRHTHNLDRSMRDDTYGIQVVGSENPYKLTLVRTDDLYHYNHFAAWENCLEAYATHMDDEGQPLDPVLMQNFAAEASAVKYERRLVRDQNLAYRPLHPRVVMLLEDPRALRQFLYLGMMGLIEESDSRKIYRWQLTWQKSTGPQTFWLTRGWNVDTDQTQRKQPDIFNAIHGYVIMKMTQESGRRDRIDAEFAQRLIDEEMKKAGNEREIKMLRANLEDDGFVGWLRSLAYDPDVPERVLRQDYADLVTIAELMINERIFELEYKQKRDVTQTGSVKGRFKTLQVTDAAGSATAPDLPVEDQNDGANDESDKGSSLSNRFKKTDF